MAKLITKKIGDKTKAEGKKPRKVVDKKLVDLPATLRPPDTLTRVVRAGVAMRAGKKPVEQKEEKAAKPRAGAFFEAVGRRKTASARVRLFTLGEKDFLVNGLPCEKYFPLKELQQLIKDPLDKMKCLDRFGVVAKVQGGGVRGQAEAVRHGVSRALVKFNADFRKRLRKVGLLTRDPRMRERKKFGLKRARKAPQWSKR